MKITNKYNLPEYLYQAAQRLVYKPKKDRMSVTHLTGAPLPRTLLMKYWDELEQDASDMLWSIHGTALDKLLKEHSQWGLTNIKLEHIFVNDGITLAGRPDCYNVLNHILSDGKDTSVWNLKEAKKEWIAQLNIYDWMLHNIVPQLIVAKLQVHAIGRDWRPGEKLRYGQTYPDIAFQPLDIPRWSYQEQTDYIDAQLKDHLLNPDRPCTSEEKWESQEVTNLEGKKIKIIGSVYEVRKKGLKGAKRVLPTKEECNLYLKKNNWVGDSNYFIKERPGECTKCERYCVTNQVCPFFEKGK